MAEATKTGTAEWGIDHVAAAQAVARGIIGHFRADSRALPAATWATDEMKAALDRFFFGNPAEEIARIVAAFRSLDEDEAHDFLCDLRQVAVLHITNQTLRILEVEGPDRTHSREAVRDPEDPDNDEPEEPSASEGMMDRKTAEALARDIGCWTDCGDAERVLIRSDQRKALVRVGLHREAEQHRLMDQA